jgi:RND family efflux transporter MFP subunit
MKLITKKIISSILVLLFGGLLLNGCNTSNADTFEKEKEKIKHVKGFKIKGLKDIREYTYPATINPEKEVRISFRVGGPIVELSLETGQRVEKSELIAKIDKRDYKVNINNLKATLNASKARLKDAELQYKRYSSLVKANAAPKSTFDQVEANFKAIKSQTRAIEKQLEQAENALKDTNLYSPISGYINEVLVENHETVANGQPIVSIVDTSSIEIQCFIPENLISKQDHFKNFSFYSNADAGKLYRAELKEIGEKATGPGQTYPLTLRSDYIETLKPGMSAMIRFNLSIDENEKLFTIPISSILSRDYKNNMVWKINTDTKTPVKTEIIIHKLISSSKAEVSGDFNEGDWIVSAGANYIDEKTKIELINPFSKTNIGNEL